MENLREINRKSWDCRQKDFEKKYLFDHRFKLSYYRLLHHKPQTWLDIGTGNGYLASLLRNDLPGSTFIGIDFVREILHEAKDLDYRLQVDIDNSYLPFSSNTFDYVTFMEVLEHLVLPAKALEEIQRVLKPGGHCLISVPNIQFIEYIFSFLRGNVPLPASDPRHMSVFTIKHLKKELTKINFDVSYVAGSDASYEWLANISKRYLCKTIIIEGKKG